MKLWLTLLIVAVAAYAGGLLFLFRDGYVRGPYPFLLTVPVLLCAWFFGPRPGAALGFILPLATKLLTDFVGGAVLPQGIIIGGSLAGAGTGFVMGKLREFNIRLRESVAARKQAERRLENEKARAEDASRAKSLFLANMSHEIRTPLHAILGTTELLEASELSAEQRRFVFLLKSSGATLLQLVNNILDISRIEEGSIRLESVVFDLHELLAGIESTMGVGAREKKLTLQVDVAADIQSARRGDPTRLSQVLVNLIGNAIKFTERGTIAVTVQADPHRPGLNFFVRDTGIGVHAERLDAIFELFSQADPSITRRFGGSGLGLAICRRLTELMGGTIEVRSREGEGSEFLVALPLPEAPGSPGAPEPGVPEITEPRKTEVVDGRPPRRVLLVEDNVDNQFLMRAFLKNTPYHIEIAADGEEGVARFTDRAFDLVLLDMQMPVMDGYTAVRAMRAHEKKQDRPPTPIIALTASALHEDRERCLAAGCDAHLPKPISRARLLETLERWSGI